MNLQVQETGGNEGIGRAEEPGRMPAGQWQMTRGRGGFGGWDIDGAGAGMA